MLEAIIDIAKTTFFSWLSILIPQERLFILYLLTALLMARLVWKHEMRNSHIKSGTIKDFFAYIFPLSIYGHRSALQDYFVYFANGFVFFAVIAQFILVEKPLASYIQITLQDIFGPVTHPLSINTVFSILLTIVVALLYDFAIFLTHVITHKFPIFWAFHKVHHSAEVLTPFTLLRMHPVDLLLNVVISLTFTGIGLGIFSYLAMHNVTVISVFGFNIVMFLFYLFGAHLRHSHVWLHYPKWLEYILISPAQHQIHHSSSPSHIDCNFGNVFSFWDRLFKTLYSPQKKENIVYGVDKNELNPYNSLAQLYLRPFVECYHIILNSLNKKIRVPSKSEGELS